jgi:putative oxidoreductase
MKIAALIARILLGLVFVVFGLNGFFHFMIGPLPSGVAGQFLGALIQSHFDLVLSAVELVGGALLLANRYVPLGLVLLGPVIVNIFFYHLPMDRSGLIIAIVVIILWGLIALRHRQYFSGLFVQRAS